MATNCAYEFKLKHFGFHDATAEDFYVSQWFDNKLVYVIYRAIIFIYWTGWIIYGSIEYGSLDMGELYPIYISHWGEWTLVVHYGLALTVALLPHVCRNKPTIQQGDLRWFHRLRWIVRTAAIASSYVVTVVFWSFPIRGRASSQVNVHRHVLNCVLVTLDLFMDRIPVRLLHFIYASLYGVAYTLFTLILHWSGTWSRFYDVMLDWDRIPGISAGVTLGIILIMAPVIHSITFGLYNLRALIARKSGCHGRMASQVQGQDNPTMEMNLPGGNMTSHGQGKDNPAMELNEA